MRPQGHGAVRMKSGIYALVCNDCLDAISLIFLSKPRAELRPAVMYPALYERIKAG